MIEFYPILTLFQRSIGLYPYLYLNFEVVSILWNINNRFYILKFIINCLNIWISQLKKQRKVVRSVKKNLGEYFPISINARDAKEQFVNNAAQKRNSCLLKILWKCNSIVAVILVCHRVKIWWIT